MSDLYEKLQCIGKGSFGEVYKGREIATDRIVALKLVDLEKADEEIDIIQREIKVMSQIVNPYVVRYHSSLMKSSTLWIIMEFMSGGSLKELLDVVGPFPEEAIATVMKALCKGLEYIHRERKVHRDIKAANILITDQGAVKLADFGVAGQMTSTVRQRNTFVGSPFWMAPEVIQRSLYNEKADMWSVGITGMELANGLPPYATKHPFRALFLIPTNDPPRLEGSQFSKSFKDFLSLCLRKDPAERAPADQLLHHPFLKKARSTSIKDLLRQKVERAGGTTSNVVLGGDSVSSSQNGTFRSRGAPGEANAQNASIWEFDFGTAESPERPPGDSSNAVEDSGVAAKRQSSSTDGTQEGTHELVEGKDREDRTSVDSAAAPPSEVLSELILPVISRIRSDEDTSGSQNSSLMASLGSLEVAFVDAESAKPGVATVLLDSLLKEAFSSRSQKIKAMVRKSMKHWTDDGT